MDFQMIATRHTTNPNTKFNNEIIIKNIKKIKRVRHRRRFHACRVCVVVHPSGRCSQRDPAWRSEAARPSAAGEVASAKTGSRSLHARCQSIRRISAPSSASRSWSSTGSRIPVTSSSITCTTTTRRKDRSYCSITCAPTASRPNRRL